MSLEWSLKAKKAKTIFFHKWNDVDIYIEDIAPETKKVYHRIVDRCFSKQYRVHTIFPLGNRETVIEACQEDKSTSTRLRLYIIDGDLNLLLGTNPYGHARLFILPCYCIENLLIDRDSAIKVLFEEDKHREEEELNAVFDFHAWIASNDCHLTDLFIEYALMRLFLPSEVSVSYNICQLLSGNNGCIDPVKVTDRISVLREKMIKKAGKDEYLYERNEIVKRIATLGDNPSLVVCSGKDYLLPLLNLRLRSVTKIKCTSESLKLRLAGDCNVSKFAPKMVACLNNAFSAIRT